jgi:hypothetical protein
MMNDGTTKHPQTDDLSNTTTVLVRNVSAFLSATCISSAFWLSYDESMG